MYCNTLSYKLWLSIILPLCLSSSSRKKSVAEAFSTCHSFVTSSVVTSSSWSTPWEVRPTIKGTKYTRSSTDRRNFHLPSSSLALFQQPSYAAILESIDEVFPPNLLDQRIALSRKDGYWPFISEGEDPPQEFVYGEFDVEFFCTALEKARQLHPNPQTFCDLGSGTGRLVLVAAALYPWKLVRGVELLPGIHEQAVEKLESCRRNGSQGSNGGSTDDTTATSSSTTSAAATPASNDSEPVSSGSSLDDYWKQYKRFSAPSPSDDWLNQLSNSLVADEEEEEEENEGCVTRIDSGLYLPNINANANQVDERIREETPSSYSNSIGHNNDNSQGDDYVVLGSKHQLRLAPIELSCGSFDDPYEFFGDADIVFCFSSAMPFHIMIDLARAVGRQCQEGTIVLTTEYRLPERGTIDPVENDPRVPHGDYELELVEELNGTNEATGGESTVFVHRLTKSLVGKTGTQPEPLDRPKPNVSDMCYNAIKSLEENNRNDPQRFLRQVSNQMRFLGLPDSWLPKINDAEIRDDESRI